MFSIELREAKVQEFINLKQGHMHVREYSLKFTNPSKYAPLMVADPRACMTKFIFRISNSVSKECKMAILVNEMDISLSMTYVKKIKEEILRERARESKKA